MAEPDTAVVTAPRKRGRPTKPRYGPDDLLPQGWRDSDDLVALIRSGNARLDDGMLARLCGVTPAMVYALRDISEGRNPSNGLRPADVIEAFSVMAKYGHAPAKGAAKPPDPQTQKSVTFVINVGAAPLQIEAPQVIDVIVEPTPQTDAPVIAVTLNVESTNA